MRLLKNRFSLLLLILIPILSLFIGFIFNEDLSTGGSKWDFNLTWTVVEKYSNLEFEDANEYTRHFPLHYFFLSFSHSIFNDQKLVRLFYLIFSFSLPIFLFLNLRKIYKFKEINLIIFSFSFLLIPLYRAEAIWANSHLTATIFFLIGNFFYLKSLEKNIFYFKLINLFFLALATYCLQTYVILYLYYLSKYFLNEKFRVFTSLFLFSCLLGIPGLYFIYLNPRTSNLTITQDFYYTFITNISIMFFFLCFLLCNVKTIKALKNEIFILKFWEILILFIVAGFVLINLDFNLLKSNLKGGGFFFKLSHFILKNNLIFIMSFLIGLFVSALIIKKEKKIFFIFLIMFLMALNFQIYQKYFEPLFLVMFCVLYKNFLLSNILNNLKNILSFYSLIVIYFIIAYINYLNNFSHKLVI